MRMHAALALFLVLLAASTGLYAGEAAPAVPAASPAAVLQVAVQVPADTFLGCPAPSATLPAPPQPSPLFDLGPCTCVPACQGNFRCFQLPNFRCFCKQI